MRSISSVTPIPIRLDPDTPRIHYHEVEVSPLTRFFVYPPYSLALASRMTEVAERQKLDLLHVHYAIPHSISALAGATDDYQPLSALCDDVSMAPTSP